MCPHPTPPHRPTPRPLGLRIGDLGVREQPKDVQQLTANITWLTYWGLHTDHPQAKWKAATRPGKAGGPRGGGEGKGGRRRARVRTVTG